MKNAKVVIGANFGDEGKGLMTNYFVAQSKDPLVVRFNGGAQAGHTVIHNGERIIFSHFGSGTALGAPTYLSKEFLCNPMEFITEYKDLNKKHTIPMIFVHPECRVTTPFDVIINQAIEKQRAGKKHGSCGIGIFETVKRSEFYKITVEDLFNEHRLAMKMVEIQDHWIEERAAFLRLKEIPEILFDRAVIDQFIEDCKIFKNKITLAYDNILELYDNIIFEGAQGLLLDWNTQYFPHATPSYTGITNVVEILKNFSGVRTEVVYMSRCYLTRHGAGPLETECAKPYKRIVDLTNQPNEWQDTLRFGLLDLDLLKQTIDKDFKQALPHFEKSISITCLDQANDLHNFKANGENRIGKENSFLSLVVSTIKPDKLYTTRSADGTKTEKFDLC